MVQYLNTLYASINAYSSVVEKLSDAVFGLVHGERLESPSDYQPELRQRRSFVGEF
jgi:hypothetical protein